MSSLLSAEIDPGLWRGTAKSEIEILARSGRRRPESGSDDEGPFRFQLDLSFVVIRFVSRFGVVGLVGGGKRCDIRVIDFGRFEGRTFSGRLLGVRDRSCVADYVGE